jgi:hypothetical protein
MRLRRRNICLLVESFAADGFEVVIDDTVVSVDALAAYDCLAPRPNLVVLAPRLDVVQRRDAGRDNPIFEFWSWLDPVMRAELSDTGAWIDSSDLSVDETVDAILALRPVPPRTRARRGR